MYFMFVFLKYYFRYFSFYWGEGGLGGGLHGLNEHLQFQLVARSDIKIDILIKILPHPNLMDIIIPYTWCSTLNHQFVEIARLVSFESFSPSKRSISSVCRTYLLDAMFFNSFLKIVREIIQIITRLQMGVPSVVFTRAVDIAVASMGHTGSERGT